jgi:hypothetical protein
VEAVRMKPKSKGNKFELLIYKDLRTLSDMCQRTIGSGSSDEPGDILFTSQRGVSYAIECKHLKDVTWKTLNRFWNKLKKQIKDNPMRRFTRCPVIIYRLNRQPIMVMCVVTLGGKNVRAITSYNLWRQLS